MDYDIAIIRELVEEALTSDMISTLCFDHFYPIYKQFTDGQNKSQRVRLLIDHVISEREVEKLLTSIEEINPNVYVEFKDRLIIKPVSDFNGEDTSLPKSYVEELNEYINKYLKVLDEDYSSMQILGMEHPVPLDNIYTEVRFVTRLKARVFKTVEELEQEARQEVERRSLAKIEKRVQSELENQVRTKAFKLIRESIESIYYPQLEQLNEEEQQTVAKLELTKAEELKQCQLSDSTLESDMDQTEHIQLELIAQKYTNQTEAVRSEFKTKRQAIELERRKRLRQAEENALAEKLTLEQLQEVKSRLPYEVERELEKEIRRELNNVILNDFGHGVSQDGPQMPGWEAIAPKSKVIVLGKPGAGKTTFLKYILLKHVRGSTSQSKLPIFITLKEFIDTGYKDILDFIVETFETYNFPNARTTVERLLRSTQPCLLLFDGLDEIPRSLQHDIIRQISKLSKRYRQNQFIVSCRTANYEGQLEGFTEVEIADFSIDQIVKFSKGWFRENNRMAVEFIKELKRHPGLHELTTTPLLLALLCIAYKRNRKFPDQRSLLYLACIDALFVDWDSSRQIHRESFLDKFDVESKKQLLGKVACDTFCEELQFFRRTEIVDRLNKNSLVLPIEPNSGASILEEFEQNHGLLVERAKDIFSFSHLTFHEFFTALHLSRNQQLDVFENLCDEVWSEVRWKEVIVFLAGLLTRTDTLLVCLRNRIKTGINLANLPQLLLGFSLPTPALQFIEWPKNKAEKVGWEAWFRCRLTEYKLHQVSYGSEHLSLRTQVSLQPLATNIANILDLVKWRKHDLYHDRPLNNALKKCLTEMPATENINSQLQSNIDVINNYFRVTSILLEILASRVKITPDLKINILEDIFKPSTEIWEYPIPAERNKLGA